MFGIQGIHRDQSIKISRILSEWEEKLIHHGIFFQESSITKGYRVRAALIPQFDEIRVAYSIDRDYFFLVNDPETLEILMEETSEKPTFNLFSIDFKTLERANHFIQAKYQTLFNPEQSSVSYPFSWGTIFLDEGSGTLRWFVKR